MENITLKEIEIIVSESQNSSFNFYQFGFFSKNGYEMKNKKTDYKLYTLKDLYK